MTLATTFSEDFYNTLAEFCKAQAHPKRLMILHILAEGEKTVSELVEQLAINQSTVSQHLAFMKRTGVVKSRRVGNTVYYSLTDPRIAEACSIISQVVRERLATKK
ncbi:MAG: metalloregulator ArsR/SmtB family transcription factor [Candidatus Caldarchaeum sp.]